MSWLLVFRGDGIGIGMMVFGLEILYCLRAMGKVGLGFEMRVANQRGRNARLTIGSSRVSEGGLGVHGADVTYWQLALGKV